LTSVKNAMMAAAWVTMTVLSSLITYPAANDPSRHARMKTSSLQPETK
jgi:hypothetical protein